MSNRLNEAIRLLDDGIDFISLNFSFKITVNRLRLFSLRKTDQSYMSNLNIEDTTRHNSEDDRIFPLETVMLQSNDDVTNRYSKSVKLHYGPYSDDLAFSMNALAIVLGEDIFFRKGAYQPESETGRKTLAHELKHIEQYRENRITKNADRNELENEAIEAEYMEMYDPDPLEEITICGKKYKLRKSTLKEIIQENADYITDWVAERKYVMDEEDYIKLLSDYRDMITSYNPMYKVNTKADRWMEQELRKELRSRAYL